MPKEITRQDRSYINGMDTLHDDRSETFAAQDRCKLLENMFPGDPPTPRNGCRDLMVDTNSVAYLSARSLFKPPALAVKNKYGNLFIFIWHNSGTYTYGATYCYGLECWDVDNEIDNVSQQRYCVVSINSEPAYFGLMALHNAVYAIFSRALAYNFDNVNCSGNKILEWNTTTSKWVAREMAISQAPTVALPVASSNSIGLTVGKWVSYAFTYIRSDDAAEILSGAPVVATTFSPGVLESVELIAGRKSLLLSGAATLSFGDATTQFDIAIQPLNIVRYTFNGTGTAPLFLTNSLVSEMMVHIDCANFDGRNNGIFKVLTVTETYFEVENIDGISETGKLLGAAGAIATKYCKVTIALPSAAELTIATDQGATHLRVYRTDHATTKEIVDGLNHRFLVDLPLYGTYFALSYVDNTSQAALEGETNYVTTTNYTDPPKGRFIATAGGRVFIGGDPSFKGRWWYSEIAGGDGGTSYAEQVPMKYASMFNLRSMWVDCDPDDGQVDTGCAVLRDDIYLFKERKIFMLRNSDITAKPERVSAEIGCFFPNTITVKTFPGYGEIVFFISQEGPAIIRAGGSVELLPGYTIKELWPGGELINKTTGESMNEYTRERVFSVVHQNTIFVLYGDSEDVAPDNLLTTNRNFGYHRSPDEAFKGCLQIVFNDFTK